jgi:hypothetical protein
MQRNTGLLSLFLFLFSYTAFSQKTDSIKNIRFISGAVGVTNNGISIVPSFSLGKPAVIFNLSVGKNRFSFDPDIRFSLSGKPWSFLFWGRYQIANQGKFLMTAGTHLGLNFKTSALPVNGDSSQTTVVRRYLAAEMFPRYMLTKNISVGIYYLLSHGLDPGTIRTTNFITFNVNFANIKLSDQFFMRINPQVYFLKLDAQDGFYFTSTFTLAKKNFPLFISSIINAEINSSIAGSKKFTWNLSLNYAFNHKYYKIHKVS